MNTTGQRENNISIIRPSEVRCSCHLPAPRLSRKIKVCPVLTDEGCRAADFIVMRRAASETPPPHQLVCKPKKIFVLINVPPLQTVPSQQIQVFSPQVGELQTGRIVGSIAKTGSESNAAVRKPLREALLTSTRSARAA